MTSDRGTSTSHRPAFAWQSDALCAQVGWHDFFLDYQRGDNPARITRARRLCRTCDVTRQCLDHAFALGTEHGGAGGRAAGVRQAAGGRDVATRGEPMRATCPACGETFAGNLGGHCRACCTTFASNHAFDAHRQGPYDARWCIPVRASELWRLSERGWTNGAPLDSDALQALRGTVER